VDEGWRNITILYAPMIKRERENVPFI